ncbi:MAG: Holliday junction branch migration protein RuvA [Lachnospiraceae bacterium]|jgi:Holliday junction DNA helicase RuvA|nr:Holliday junction branch migration protein RuvA [Lachnospiraceae bacterium]
MYAFIKGRIDDISEGIVTIDVNGVGYEIFVPVSVLEQLPAVGNEVKLYTFLNVREDAMVLYGFSTREDKRIFQMLLGVSGIGPKGALSILSAMTPDELKFAILAGDDKQIAKAPGIGKKMAQKMIIELKDKLDLAEALETSLTHSQITENASTSAKNDAISALTSLGYSATESMRAVSECEILPDMDVEAILKQALKKLAF